MKKLLLLILPLLLFMGVSFGELLLNPVSSLMTSNVVSNSYAGGSVFTIGEDRILSGIYLVPGITCTERGITYLNSDGYPQELYTGTISAGDPYVPINKPVTGGVAYMFGMKAPPSFCNIKYRDIGKFNAYAVGVVTFTTIRDDNIGSSPDYTTRIYNFSGILLSDPVSTPVNIRYNGTSMAFAGDNIYLGGAYAITASGADYIYTPYTYRAIFRNYSP